MRVNGAERESVEAGTVSAAFAALARVRDERGRERRAVRWVRHKTGVINTCRTSQET